MPSGVTLATAPALGTTVGVVYRTIAGARTKMGGTAGAPKVTPKVTHRNVATEIDGVPTPIRGFDVIDENTAEVSFTLVEITAQNLADAMMGATLATSGTSSTITPATSSTLFRQNQYVDALEIDYRVGVDGLITFHTVAALCTKADLDAANKKLLQMACTFEARLDLSVPGSTTDDAPYWWTYLAPTIT